MARHRHKRLTPKDKLVVEKVKAERARRQKIEASLPPPDETQYSRIEDLPPLHPDDEAYLKEQYYDLAFTVMIQTYNKEMQANKDDWHAMNDWLCGRRNQSPSSNTSPEHHTEQETNSWEGITHNGDAPWDTGLFLDTPRAQKFAAQIEGD